MFSAAIHDWLFRQVAWLTLMILHIMNDEKFADEAYRVFELVVPGRNEYVVVGRIQEFTHIKAFQPRVISPRASVGSAFLYGLRSYKVVILHRLHPAARRLLRHAPDNVNFVWIGWGQDYYRLICPDYAQLLLPHTRRLYNLLSPHRWLNVLLSRFHIRPHPLIAPEMMNRKYIPPDDGRSPGPRSLEKVFKKWFIGSKKELQLINRKVKYFAPVIREDYQLIREKAAGFRPSYVSWNYGNIARLIETLTAVPTGPTGRNILLGNSATFTNNHLDIFRVLKRVNLDRRCIYCPLSYGKPLYGRVIRRKGERLFRGKFRVLDRFVPFDQYWEILRTCSVVVMNHLRQQAVGNINAMLLLGAVVFLRRENSYYRFLKKQGAVVFAVDEFEATLKKYDEGLSAVQVARNQDIVRRHFGLRAICDKTRILLESAGYFQ